MLEFLVSLYVELWRWLVVVMVWMIRVTRVVRMLRMIVFVCGIIRMSWYVIRKWIC